MATPLRWQPERVELCRVLRRASRAVALDVEFLKGQGLVVPRSIAVVPFNPWALARGGSGVCPPSPTHRWTGMLLVLVRRQQPPSSPCVLASCCYPT